MKKGILIVGEENALEMRVLEQQLASRLKQRAYPVSGEYFWPGGEETKVFSFRKKGHVRKLSTDRIIFLEKDMRRIIIHLEKQADISFYGSMEEALKQLGNNFIHCHKSYVVNMDKVDKMEDSLFRMMDGSEIPIGQRRMCMVRERYRAYKEQKNLEKLRFFEKFSCFEI